MEIKNRDALYEAAELVVDMQEDLGRQIDEVFNCVALLLMFYEEVTEVKGTKYEITEEAVRKEIAHIQEMKREWREMINGGVSAEANEEGYEPKHVPKV